MNEKDFSNLTDAEKANTMKRIINKELNINDIDKKLAFYEEINNIQTESIRNFVILAKNNLPDYFWYIEASSSGKYHPNLSLGTGGLIRHTKACLVIAEELFRFVTLYNFTELEKDIVRASLLLHDGVKRGVKDEKETKHEHPIMCAAFIRSLETDCERDYVERIAECVETHMSSWNANPDKSPVVLPLPTKDIQKFVALCDYIASRKIYDMPLFNNDTHTNNRIEYCKKLLETQKLDGNWNYDSHMYGIYAGMEFLVATLEGREPVYKLRPEKWLKDES